MRMRYVEASWERGRLARALAIYMHVRVQGTALVAASYSLLSDNLMVSDVKWCPVIDDLLYIQGERSGKLKYPHQLSPSYTNILSMNV